MSKENETATKSKKPMTKMEAARKISNILAQLPDEQTRRDVLAFVGTP